MNTDLTGSGWHLMGDVGRLLCGKKVDLGIAKNAFDQLERSIDNFSGRTVKYLNEPANEDTLNFGPFCSRVLLENACAALLGRLDAFRVMYLSEFQTQPEYEHGKRARSSFSWFGDVMPEDKGSILWSLDSDTSKISRALFSRHLDHIYWKPAVESMLDYVGTGPSNLALTELLTLDAENFVNTCRGRGSQLYSTLSKGVHWEFFTNALVFDESTVKSALRETVLFVIQLGLASHFVPTALACLDPEEAVKTYAAIRKVIP